VSELSIPLTFVEACTTLTGMLLYTINPQSKTVNKNLQESDSPTLYTTLRPHNNHISLAKSVFVKKPLQNNTYNHLDPNRGTILKTVFFQKNL
jgi:hypothetical protein